MKLLEKVLVPTDFTPKVKSILPLMGRLSSALGCKVMPMHVACRLPECAERTAQADEEIRSAMQGLVRDLEEAGATNVEPLFYEGNPELQIELAAAEHNVDVVVLALDDKRIDSNIWFGTITQKLLRRVEAPLWIARVSASHSFRNILCAVDLSESSGHALQAAIDLARSFLGKLTVVHVISNPVPQIVVESGSWLSDDVAELADSPSFPLRNSQESSVTAESRMASARSVFDAFLDKFDFSDIRWERILLSGSPVDQILSLTRDRSCDLLLLGSRDKSGSGHLSFAGDSASESIVDAVRIPVIVFRGRTFRSSRSTL